MRETSRASSRASLFVGTPVLLAGGFALVVWRANGRARRDGDGPATA